MPPGLLEPASSAVLAAVSTAHLLLALLRRHRSAPRRFSTVVIPGFLFVALPWVFPAPAALAAFFAGHLLWFAACERAYPPPDPVPPGYAEVEVLGIADQTEDIRTFRLRRPKGFEFKPGQFLTVQVKVGGKAMVRCYSICSPPESKDVLEISVKRQGAVSGALHATLRRGSTLFVRRPAGPFVYPGGDGRPLVLLAGGVGITPLISMLRHAVIADPERPVTLVLSVRTPEDVPFRAELTEIAARHPRARVVIAVTRGTAGPGMHAGHVDVDLLLRITGGPARAVYCICGPPPMIDGMRRLLASLGVPEPQVHAEAFQSAVDSAASAGGASVPVNLRLEKTGRTVRVPPGRSLLDAAEAAGAEIPFSCRAGVCQSCRTRLLAGEVDCEAPARDDQDRDRGYIYPCVAWAKTELHNRRVRFRVFAHFPKTGSGIQG